MYSIWRPEQVDQKHYEIIFHAAEDLDMKVENIIQSKIWNNGQYIIKK